MITASHSGDIGDIIYAGPTLKALAAKKGELIDLVIFPVSLGRRVVQSPLTAEPLAILMRQQSYIGRCRFEYSPEGIDLDAWRRDQMVSGVWDFNNLATVQLRQLGLDPADADLPWLAVKKTKRIAPVIIHRSPRYHAPAFPWHELLSHYRGNLAMVGSVAEHMTMCEEFDVKIPYVFTADLLELASVIAGADLFIGNQSAPYAIAEGLKQQTIQETSPQEANCIFPRHGSQYISHGQLAACA